MSIDCERPVARARTHGADSAQTRSCVPKRKERARSPSVHHIARQHSSTPTPTYFPLFVVLRSAHDRPVSAPNCQLRRHGKGPLLLSLDNAACVITLAQSHVSRCMLWCPRPGARGHGCASCHRAPRHGWAGASVKKRRFRFGTSMPPPPMSRFAASMSNDGRPSDDEPASPPSASSDCERADGGHHTCFFSSNT